MARARLSRRGLCCLAVFVVAGASSAIAAKPSDETPAQRGYRLLTTKPYFARDFDQSTFDELWQVWEEPARGLAEKADKSTRRKMAFERYGLQPSPDAGYDRPLQYVETRDGGWTVNCFSCHGGKVAGQVIPGLPNSHVALQTMQEDIYQWLAKHNRLAEMVDNGMPGVPLGGSIGTTNAVVFGIALGSQRDRELNFIAGRRLPPMLHHDHDAPPWWNVSRKTMLYADGFAPKSHRALMPFLMLPQTGKEKFAEWEDDFKDILAYIESIPAPKYPFSIDQTLADKGQLAFNRVCSECHGTYGPGGEYPQRIVAIDEVGTDPSRWRALPPLARMGHQLGWFGEYGKHKVNATPEGYVAPPLNGVWASAPYLHNGSVPTLWNLFHVDSRPAIWTRSEDGYDQNRVGLEFTAVTDLPPDADTPAERRRYFDTRVGGKSNAGHEFPEQLSEDEKTAVIEYLKTL
jgi:mono/diheme cytochrome c family protein